MSKRIGLLVDVGTAVCRQLGLDRWLAGGDHTGVVNVQLLERECAVGVLAETLDVDAVEGDLQLAAGDRADILGADAQVADRRRLRGRVIAELAEAGDPAWRRVQRGNPAADRRLDRLLGQRMAGGEDGASEQDDGGGALAQCRADHGLSSRPRRRADIQTRKPGSVGSGLSIWHLRSAVGGDADAEQLQHAVRARQVPSCRPRSAAPASPAQT